MGYTPPWHSTVWANLVNHNRGGGDLRGVDGRAGSRSEEPEGNWTSDRVATGRGAKGRRGADVAGRIPRVLHSNDFSVGGL